MKIPALVVGSFLLVNIALWANPFIGNWVCDSDSYSFTDAHVTGIMDGDPYDSDYTYTDATMVWQDRTWVYRFRDADHFILLGFVGPEGQPMIWPFKRLTAVQKERMVL